MVNTITGDEQEYNICKGTKNLTEAQIREALKKSRANSQTPECNVMKFKDKEIRVYDYKGRMHYSFII